MHDPEVSLPIGAVTFQNTLALHGKSSPAGYLVVCARLMHDPEVSLPIGAVTFQNTLALHGKSSPAGYLVVCARLMHDPEVSLPIGAVTVQNTLALQGRAHQQDISLFVLDSCMTLRSVFRLVLLLSRTP